MTFWRFHLYSTVVQYNSITGITVTYPAPRTGDGVLTDRVRLRHDLHARVLVVLEGVAVHLAGYAVLVVAHLVPAETYAGTLAAHDLVVPDDCRARAAVDACTDNTTQKRRQNETRIAKKKKRAKGDRSPQRAQLYFV